MSYYLQKLPTNWNDTPAQGQFNGSCTSPDGEILKVQDSDNLTGSYGLVPIPFEGFAIRVTPISSTATGANYRPSITLGSQIYRYNISTNDWVVAVAGTNPYNIDFQDNILIILSRVDSVPISSSDFIAALFPNRFANTTTETRFERMMVTDPPIIYDTTPCLTNELRMRIGKTPSARNVVTNGTFADTQNSGNDATAWQKYDLSYGWRINNEVEIGFNSNAATFFGDTINDKYGGAIYQPNALLPGNEYRIQWEVQSNTGGNAVFCRVGERATDYNGGAVGEHSVDRLCLSRGDLGFEAHIQTNNNVSIKNIRAYRLNWNEPLKSLPYEFEAGVDINIDETEDVRAMFSELLDRVTFTDDAYQYLRDYMRERNFCDLRELPILFEQRDTSGNWHNFFEGVILLQKAVENDPDKTITAPVEDRGAMALIVAKKDVELQMIHAYEETTTTPATWYNRHTLDRASYLGLEDSDLTFKQSENAYTAFDAFEFIVDQITDSRAEVKSSLLTGYYGAQYGTLLVSTLSATPSDIGGSFNMTFKKLFDAVHKLFNITLSVSYPNNVPTVNIEQQIKVRQPSIIYTTLNKERAERRYADRIETGMSVGLKTSEDFDPITLIANPNCDTGVQLDLQINEFTVVDAEWNNVQSNLLNEINETSVILAQGDINAFISMPFISKFASGNSAVPPYIFPFIGNYDASYVTNTRTGFNNIREFIFQIPQHAATMPFDVSGRIGLRVATFSPSLPNEIINQTFSFVICPEDYQLITAKNVAEEILNNPRFKTSQGWSLNNWTIANGRASSTYTSVNNLRQLFAQPLEQGTYYEFEVFIYGICTLNTDTEVKVYACDDTFTQLYTIGTITPIGSAAGQVASRYSFHFENTSADFEAIEIKLEQTGTGGGAITFEKVSLRESISIVNIQKQIKINSEVGRIKSLSRNTRTGLAEITIKTPDTWR